MNTDFNNYQYNRCSSRGICSINPATAALQEILVMYLKCAAFYGLKMMQMGYNDKRIENLILNTISIIYSNVEISESNFNTINDTFQKEFPKIIKLYEELCIQKNIEFKKCIYNNIFDEQISFKDYIRLGEQKLNERIKNLSNEIVSLYKIILIIIKSICINILVCKSYNLNSDKEMVYILELLNLLNQDKKEKEELQKIIREASVFDCNLIEKIRKIQIEYYGEQKECNVSFSTQKGKAILVVGSNLRELEQILDKFEDTCIDIYTHDNMMLAHTFPKFQENKRLKGHYGQGMENCLLDFSTFPGPIILTRHSLFNVENLYRGRLYTTDLSHSNGVIPISEDNFDSVINATLESRGFKTGKSCKPERVGFSYEHAFEEIDNKIKNHSYTQIIIYGIKGFSQEENEYFEELIKILPEDVLLISLTCCNTKDNILCFNALSDNRALLKISEYVVKTNFNNIDIFIPFCDRHALSILIKLASYKADIFVGIWNQTILNPNIIRVLKSSFNINELTVPKIDISKD